MEAIMDLRLRFLESFLATGSDGRTHKVRAYDRLVQVPTSPGGDEQWESTGVAEYRLDDGRLVEVLRDGSLRIAGSDVVLEPATEEISAGPAAAN
jgi:hypothetical protein